MPSLHPACPVNHNALSPPGARALTLTNPRAAAAADVLLAWKCEGGSGTKATSREQEPPRQHQCVQYHLLRKIRPCLCKPPAPASQPAGSGLTCVNFLFCACIACRMRAPRVYDTDDITRNGTDSCPIRPESSKPTEYCCLCAFRVFLPRSSPVTCECLERTFILFWPASARMKGLLLPSRRKRNEQGTDRPSAFHLCTGIWRYTVLKWCAQCAETQTSVDHHSTSFSFARFVAM
ncbi:hypothetical protein B0J12DRAFT_79842 [Macrophomina phaseolina]|uniref:Uncharacterized protein n=1 Tax=Macrophomina phaseolina TaxID=35725 RepID=A0ABQ8GCH5_9PEZI|nr:hypothetical protein B0J12DRAFT_79842 [Macrophomina phaseolina]